MPDFLHVGRGYGRKAPFDLWVLATKLPWDEVRLKALARECFPGQGDRPRSFPSICLGSASNALSPSIR